MPNDLKVKIDEKYINTDKSRTKILGSCHFDLISGELLVVLGESGCGKSTLLRLILALDNDYLGSITCGGSLINSQKPTRGIVFQEPRLLPWMTALQNIEFAMSGDDSGETRRKRAKAMLKLVGLEGSENKWPRELSGGMAQRAALARALVNMPEILLMDEPFAALDLHTRFRLQNGLLNILRETDTSTVLVTHDIDEALYLGDRILVMTGRPGHVKSIHVLSEPKPRKRSGSELIELRTLLLEQMISQ